MADDILQGVLLSRKETKTLKQLKDMGNVKVPVQKKDINYYVVALEEFLQEEAVTFYLDTANGDDTNSGLSRSKPMKTVAAVVALARSMAGGDYFVRKYRLTILGEGETISFNGATHTNTVLFDTSAFRSDPYVAESDYLPFQVITSEDRATSLIFANGLKITGDTLFIGCNGSVTVTNGSSLSVSGNVYVKAKNLTLTNAGSIGGGGDTIVDVSGTLEMSYGGEISCGGDIVVNAKNIKLLMGCSLSNGGSRYFRASRDLTVEYMSYALGASSGITDIEAGNDILIRYLTNVPVSVGSTYPFNMRAGNDITIHTTAGICNSKGNNIVAGGTVRIAKTIMPYGANITAKNITDVIDEDIKGDVFIGQSLDKTMRWEAYDTIELYATLIANNNPSVGCYFKAYRMKLGGNYFRISGDVFLESHILQARYLTNGNVGQDYPFIANTNLTVKTAILTHNHEDYVNMSGFINIVEVTEDSRQNRIQITADLITEDVQINISGLSDAYIEANKIISTQLFALNLDECVQNGCDRRVIDKSRLLPAYDVVIANRLGLEGTAGAYDMMAKDLKEALESPDVESIYLTEPVSLEEDVVLGNNKVLYGESLSYSGVMTGASTVKFFNHLEMNEGTFSCAAVYSRTVNGNLTIGGTCNFYYERILGGTATVGETASYSYMAWETETYAVADEETITGGAALGTDLKVLNAPVLRQPVFNNTGATISKGTPVVLTGASVESITIAKLVSSTTITEQVNVGIVDADILSNMEGYAVRSGVITMDTSAWEEDDILYASTTAGVLSNLRPTKGYGVIPVGLVIKKDGINAGKVLVNPSSVPRISQLTDVDIVDALPNQVLSINNDGLVENRFITFVAAYNVTENAVIDEEFNKGSIILCYRGYAYAEYLPMIRRISKTSYPDPETYIYVFGAVHDGKVVEITCDPVDGWSVLETPVGGSGTSLDFWPANLVPGDHVGLGSAFFEFPDGSCGLLTRHAPTHVNNTAGKIVLYKSDNGGRDFNPIGTTILDTPGTDDRDLSFAVMDNGRVGAVVSRPTTVPVFVYSDDNGDTWSTITISSADVNLSVWHNMVKYPTSAGGADDGGWIIFGAISGTLDGIKAIYTLDNGETWSYLTVLADAATVRGSEPTVEYIEALGLWVMVYRNNADALGPAYLSTSTDLTTWEDSIALDFTMGQHPPCLFFDAGKLWLYAAIRHRLDHVTAWKNKLIRASVTVQEISEGDWSGFSDANFETVVAMDNILGYLTLRRDNSGGVIGSLAYNESDDQTTSKIALVSSKKPVGLVSYRTIKPLTVSSIPWTLEWDRGSNEYLKQVAHEYTLNSEVTSLSATVTFPVAFPSGWKITVTPVLRWATLTSVSVNKLTLMQVSSLTETGCIITLFSQETLNTGVDTAQVDIIIEGYPPINTDK